MPRAQAGRRPPLLLHAGAQVIAGAMAMILLLLLLLLLIWGLFYVIISTDMRSLFIIVIANMGSFLKYYYY